MLRWLAVSIVLGYLLGSIPTSLWLTRRRGVDIRRVGSGNPGATNVYRALGQKLGLTVLAVDLGKGLLASRIGMLLVPESPPWTPEAIGAATGFAAIVGHVWPLYARFRGGKGVATAGGTLLAIHPLAFVGCLATFSLLVAATRYVSVASLGAALGLLAALVLLRIVDFGYVPSPAFVSYSLMTALLLLFTHRSNIANLRAGTESRI